MLNVNQITSQLARMPDQALQQYAKMHKNDPYTVSLALAESNRRKQMRDAAQGQQGMAPQPKVVDQGIAEMSYPEGQAQAMPEDVGIGALAAPNMQNFAEGGIVAFAGGDRVVDPLAQYIEQIRAEAIRQNVDPDMAVRLFKTESAGNPNAIGPKTKTGERAVGMGQMMEAASKDMGLKLEDRTNPDKSIPASIGYFKKQLNTFKDPQTALAAYNFGPGNVQKHLAQNNGQLNPAGLPKETANYINKILPMGTAYAAPATQGVASIVPANTDDARRAAMLAKIPGAAPAAQTAQLPAGPAPTGNEIVKGTAKTAFALGQNLLAVPAAGVSTLARKAFGDPTANFDETLRRYSYSPDDAVSQQQLSNIGQTMSDLKVPAYIPTLGGLRGASRAGAANDAAAIAKTQNLRLGSNATKLDRNNATGMANLATDEAAAAAARTRQGAAKATNAEAQAVNKTLPIASNLSMVGGNALTGVNAANMYPDSAEVVPAPAANADSSDRNAEYRRQIRESEAAMPKEDAAPIIAAAKAEVPKAERKGMTNDDYLTLGLNLLASKSPQFMGALGEAGLATLKSQKERVKDEREIENDRIKNLYYKGLARQAEATAGSYESGSRLMPQAMAAGNAAYDDWFKSLSPIQQMELKPGQAEAKRQELLQAAMAQFRMSGGAGSSPQLSTADQSLIAKYAR